MSQFSKEEFMKIENPVDKEDFLKALSAEVSNKLNVAFKQMETYKDFMDFLKDIQHPDVHIDICGKKRGYEAFHFTHRYEERKRDGSPTLCTNSPYYLNRVSYLYSDGASTGESYVKNLHRVLKIRASVFAPLDVVEYWNKQNEEKREG